MWLIAVLARHLGIPAWIAILLGVPASIAAGIFGFLAILFALDRLLPSKPAGDHTDPPEADDR